MNKLLKGFALVTGALVTASASAAITVNELKSVVNTNLFGASVNNWAGSISATNPTIYSISINDSPTFLQVTASSTGLQAFRDALATQIAGAADLTYYTKTFNGQSYQIPNVRVNSDVKLTVAQGGTVVTTAGQPNTVTGGTAIADLTLGAGFEFNADPYISFPFSVTNRGTSTATYSFSIPLVLSPVLTPAIAPQTQVKSNLTGFVTDQNASGAVTIAPTAGAIVRATVLDGATPVSLVTDIGGSFTAGTGTTAYPGAYNPGIGAAPFKAGPVPTTGFNTLTQVTSFTLTAGDRVTMTAYSEIVPIPEPSTYALMIAGLTGTGLLVARRRRSGAPSLR
jgi:hypothetical protein